MKMNELPLAPIAVSVSGIDSGDYFAIESQGMAMIYRCRTHAHGVLFDDREEPKPFKAQECYALLSNTDANIQKLQHQCIVDRNKVLGVKNGDKNYEQIRSQELVDKYAKNKKK